MSSAFVSFACPVSRAGATAASSSRGSPHSRTSRWPARGSRAILGRQGASRRGSVVRASQLAGQEGATLVSETTTASTVPKSKVWELDFCSRPILDERKKKVWELLVCDPDRTFEYALFLPNNQINSATLKGAIDALLQQPGATKPEVVKFFRGQMQTIITRALGELNIKALPSRRCLTIMGMLEERQEKVYVNMEGYDPTATTLFTLDQGAPKNLPDALRGEQWAFVQLPLSAVMKEVEAASRSEIFGASLDTRAAGVQAMLDAGEDPVVPGVCVFSRRAAPLAGWTNGLELARLEADSGRACLILETGVADRWTYGQYPRTPQAKEEADAWNAAKAEVQGLHFLAVQADPEDEEIAGFWLLQDREPPAI